MIKAYTKSTLKKIETIFDQLGYTIRYEKGQFKSGYCVVKNRNIVVVNKFFELKERIITLQNVLETIDLPDHLELDPKSLQLLSKLKTRDLFSSQTTAKAS